MQETTKELTENSESVVAVLPARSTKEEDFLSHSVTATELEAESITIANDGDYSAAAEFGKRLKNMQAEVVGFWKPKKDAANKLHREMCDGEKKMLAPLTRAESVLKIAMGTYALKKERERAAAEEEARSLAREEAEKKLAEAIKHEEAGDTGAAASAMLDAQMADSMSRNVSISVAPPKASGVSQSRDWELVSVNSEQVPITLSGMELRPVDEKAVIRLIRASKGKIVIPGVTYRETIKTSIRR